MTPGLLRLLAGAPAGGRDLRHLLGQPLRILLALRRILLGRGRRGLELRHLLLEVPDPLPARLPRPRPAAGLAGRRRPCPAPPPAARREPLLSVGELRLELLALLGPRGAAALPRVRELALDLRPLLPSCSTCCGQRVARLRQLGDLLLQRLGATPGLLRLLAGRPPAAVTSASCCASRSESCRRCSASCWAGGRRGPELRHLPLQVAGRAARPPRPAGPPGRRPPSPPRAAAPAARSPGAVRLSAGRPRAAAGRRRAAPGAAAPAGRSPPPAGPPGRRPALTSASCRASRSAAGLEPLGRAWLRAPRAAAASSATCPWSCWTCCALAFGLLARRPAALLRVGQLLAPIDRRRPCAARPPAGPWPRPAGRPRPACCSSATRWSRAWRSAPPVALPGSPGRAAARRRRAPAATAGSCCRSSLALARPWSTTCGPRPRPAAPPRRCCSCGRLPARLVLRLAGLLLQLGATLA